VRFLNWNIHGASGIRPAKQTEIVKAILELDADVLLLQEVPLGTGFLERLTPHGYAATEPERHPIGLWENKKKNAAAIASRLPMTELSPPEGLRFPRLFSVARIGGLEIASCHIPNASGFNSVAKKLGLTPDIKVTHLERALNWLRGGRGKLLAGDFNEPDFFRDGRAIGFEATRAVDRDRQRTIVDELMNSDSIAHLCSHLHAKSDEPSHWIKSGPHPDRKGWFDHALTTDESARWTATYLHDLRIARDLEGKERYSDHSPLLLSSE
jgi:exonuclease III